ncbi:hypothetical protein BCR41DRAFT_178214 [Lobosporangium transversale]|uniref:CDT1 Geminin-binding domain-containing protein n=1 Tax=Lobosporangium transversale TaxID=64571 RepID=A0A1Y2GYR2_9FUNG|nr:hypothetical protein BCR41DRAFT_178214 [Lobosporangium transversale]ORZ26901.1 hypothetical protein BCR41DRAFT_178214 [Lobosporangium transversale]|eukprot:XP_021884648.1 hypothetical protein BCR41DRAFT_178214 [Lobosporangium transversale]
MPVETDTVQSTAPYKVTQKPVVEDTILQDSSEGCFTEKEVEGEDEDNIHPLARTVVKVAPRSRKPQVEEEIINTNSPKVDTRSPYNIPAKVAQMTTIREPKTDAFTLPLPSHMAVLLANFNAFENLLIFSKRQGRPCFYHRLKRHVELHSSRNFEISHLAQFKTLLPEGYRFTAAPCMVDGVKTRSIFIEMLNLEDESNHFVPQAEKRKKLFLERLHNHVKAFHQKFLTSTTPPRTDTYPRSWHPEFDLESVTPVEESEVPLLKPAVIDVWKVDLKDLRSQNHVRQQETKTEVPASTTSDVEEKKSVASAESDKNDTTSIPTTTTTPITDTSSATKPLTALEQLKERIRLKQLEMKEASKTLASPEEKHERLIASRLPNVFDLVRFKRVDVTPLKSLVELVVKSSRMPISEVEGRESLEMLAKFLPEWCTVFSLADGCQYFKVLRDNEKGEKIAHDERALRARLVSKSSRKP